MQVIIWVLQRHDLHTNTVFRIGIPPIYQLVIINKYPFLVFPNIDRLPVLMRIVLR